MDFVKLMESLSVSENTENGEKVVATFYKSVCAEIDDVPTEFVYADHLNKLVIFITQYEKIGSFMSVTKDLVECAGADLELLEVVYTVNCIFGRIDCDLEAAARLIAEKLKIDKTLYIFISLRNYEIRTITGIVDVLKEIKAGSAGACH